MTTPLISLDFLKSFLPIRAGNTSYDAKLIAIVEGVSGRIEEAVHRTFAKQEYVEHHSARLTRLVGYDFAGDSESGLRVNNSEQTLILRAAPIDTGAALSVWYDPKRVFGDDTLLTPDQYFVEAEKGQVIVNIPTRSVRSGFRVTYTAGYAVSGGSLNESLPASLKLAVVSQCIHVFNTTNPENVSTGTDGTDGEGSGAPFVVKGGLLPEVVAAFGPYRRVLTGNG